MLEKDKLIKSLQGLCAKEKEKRFNDWFMSRGTTPINVPRLVVEKQISLLLGKKVSTKHVTFVGETTDFSDPVS